METELEQALRTAREWADDRPWPSSQIARAFLATHARLGEGEAERGALMAQVQRCVDERNGFLAQVAAAESRLAQARVEGAREAIGNLRVHFWGKLLTLAAISEWCDREYPAPSAHAGEAQAQTPLPPHEPDLGRTGNPVQWCERCRIDAHRPAPTPEPRIAKPSAQVLVGQKIVQRWESDGFGRTWYRIVQQNHPTRDYADFRAMLHALMSNPPLPTQEEYAALVALGSRPTPEDK